MSDVLTVREAAEELKVSVRTASRIFADEPGGTRNRFQFSIH